MIVLHNSDHFMSISDIFMCVSESPGAKGGCRGAPVHRHWCGRVQPDKKTIKRKEYHWPVCHCWSPCPTRREHPNVCTAYPPSPCYPWPLQHRPSDHNPRHTTQHTHSIRSGRWPRAAQVRCHLGQCKFQQGCSGSQLVHCPPTLFSCSYFQFLNPIGQFYIHRSYWGIFFCLEMESVRTKSINKFTVSPSYGGRMWRYSSWLLGSTTSYIRITIKRKERQQTKEPF